MVQSLRLVEMACDPVVMQYVRDASRRANVQPGDRVVDVGCGPLGALHVFDELVGPAGLVVGMDDKPDVLDVARGEIRRRRLDRVQLVHADINAIEPSAACPPGPFDLAYCRLLLCNQADPETTLRQIASIMKPGGRIIAHEWLDDPRYPWFDPPIPASRRLFELIHETMRHRGKHPEVARDFPTIARRAGLIGTSHLGLLDSNPANAPRFIRLNLGGLLLSFEEAIVHDGIATRESVQELASQFQAAGDIAYRAFFSWIFVELIAAVPGA